MGDFYLDQIHDVLRGHGTLHRPINGAQFFGWCVLNDQMMTLNTGYSFTGLPSHSSPCMHQLAYIFTDVHTGFEL